ncbi:MAG: PaaI family thioesterase [Candidatus Binatia bacterium]
MGARAAGDIARLVPFAGELGMTVEGSEPGRVSGRLPWRAELCTTADVMHGGALMAFADTLGAVCASLNLPEGAGTATIESKTNFFRAVRTGEVHAETRPLHVGRTTIVVQTDLRDDAGKLVAQTTQTQAVIQR